MIIQQYVHIIFGEMESAVDKLMSIFPFHKIATRVYFEDDLVVVVFSVTDLENNKNSLSDQVMFTTDFLKWIREPRQEIKFKFESMMRGIVREMLESGDEHDLP